MLNLFDECDAAKVHVGVFLRKSILVVYAVWNVVLCVVAQLTCSEHESEVLVVIEAPNSVRAGWL